RWRAHHAGVSPVDPGILQTRGGGTIGEWRMSVKRLLKGLLSSLVLLSCMQWSGAGAGSSDGRDDVVKSANLIYAGSKSSVCFSDKFLATVGKESNITADSRFTPVKLSATELFDYPFAIMTGEGALTLLEPERQNLN